ncbi:hypothetical protein PORCRE_11 [Porphyromonas crevioricanis JCM 15906]|uniref:Uncharacterized protein n=1 Tax=Porphyromonas crevioricanis JCM 15906 TaxID=1305617 RepID=S4PFT2_9PORP|nr:hypothetical protein PORCRE_11 [Porphyromonas crevioricanis JCM 15906]
MLAKILSGENFCFFRCHRKTDPIGIKKRKKLQVHKSHFAPKKGSGEDA